MQCHQAVSFLDRVVKVIGHSKSKGRWSLPFVACLSFRLDPTANSSKRGFAAVDHGHLPFESGIKASF